MGGSPILIHVLTFTCLLPFKVREHFCILTHESWINWCPCNAQGKKINASALKVKKIRIVGVVQTISYFLYSSGYLLK